MLKDSEVMSTIAVKDINMGQQFYGQTLGLEQIDENPGGITYQSGDGKLFIYESTTAGTGQATCAVWSVSDIDTAMDDLQARGIKFEHYDMPGTILDGDVHIMGSTKAAWFKDPDGNILGLSEIS